MVDTKQAPSSGGKLETGREIVAVLRSKESDHAHEARRSLFYSAAFGLAASVFAWMTLRGYRSLRTTAQNHAQWKHDDERLDEAVESSLDASDAVARY